MRALESWKSEPVLREVPTPVPGPGEVTGRAVFVPSDRYTP